MTSPLYAVEAASDEKKTFDTLAMAFANDAMMRWMYPTANQYFTNFPGFVKALAGRTFEKKTAWRLGDYSAVALWLPPGEASDEEAIGKHVFATVAEEKLEDLAKIVERIGVYHPTDAHWYLPWLGVDLTQQGRGLGSQLLKHTLAAVDKDRLPAFLETANPRNVPLYERHGFDVAGVAETKTAPTVYFMLRPAR